MRSPRPLPPSRRALGAACLGVSGALVFALGVRLGTSGLPPLSGSARFNDVTSGRVALVDPPALPALIPYGTLPIVPLSDETARALLEPITSPAPPPPGPTPQPETAPAPPKIVPAPLPALPVAPAPVVLPDPTVPVADIPLPDTDSALEDPVGSLEPLPVLPALEPLPSLSTVPQVVTVVRGLLPLPTR